MRHRPGEQRRQPVAASPRPSPDDRTLTAVEPFSLVHREMNGHPGCPLPRRPDRVAGVSHGGNDSVANLRDGRRHLGALVSRQRQRNAWNSYYHQSRPRARGDDRRAGNTNFGRCVDGRLRLVPDRDYDAMHTCTPSAWSVTTNRSSIASWAQSAILSSRRIDLPATATKSEPMPVQWTASSATAASPRSPTYSSSMPQPHAGRYPHRRRSHRYVNPSVRAFDARGAYCSSVVASRRYSATHSGSNWPFTRYLSRCSAIDKPAFQARRKSPLNFSM